MKLFFILCYAVMSINTYAAGTCDLNISVNKITEAKQTIIVFQDSLRGDYEKGQQAIQDLLDSKLLNKCITAGAENCTIKNRTSSYDIAPFYGSYWKVNATVEGTALTGGKKLSDSEYAKKRQQLICQKIDSCITDALNDNESPLVYMQKLYMVKDQNNCQQIENIIFNN